MQGQCLFLTLARGHLHMKIKTLIFSRTTGLFLTKFCMLACSFVEMNNHKYNAGHMTKMAAL